ncbi:MAG: filamentous hemagglutinin N-terminal domain-containing protein [Xenococcus sp. (in: cyanobacteria)]
MNKKLSLLLLLSYSIFNLSKPAIAQVVPDGTTNTTVDVSGNDFTIEQGDRAGGNLFHSFSDFSVPNGGSAFFNNAADIVNIFSRVTGGNISDINGLLRANGAANLFLINPAGIIFGEGARLDIGGSFYGSTADSIVFSNGEFSATDLANPPLITINAPIGLNLRDNPGDIVNRSVADDVGLQVPSGRSLTLVGGNINLEAGKITAPGGIVNLGGLSAAGEINFNPDGSLAFPDGVTRSNISLSNQAEVTVRSNNDGGININANQLELTGESLLAAGIEAELGFPGAQADNITIDANSIIASGDSEIRNENLGIGDAGNINITTETLEFTEGSAIVASTFGQGNGGDITITATGDVTFDRDFGGVFSTVAVNRDEREANVAGVVGNGGNISVTANSLFLTNGATFDTKLAGVGDGGNITLNISETTLIEGFGDNNNFTVATAILAQIEGENEEGIRRFSGQGKGGNVTINTGDLIIRSVEDQGFGPFILADNRGGVGNTGNIIINATGSISLETLSELNTEITENAIGNAGSIELKTNTLSLNGASFKTNTRGQGNGGDIIIEATDVSLEKSQISSQSSGVRGNAGNIIIDATDVSIDQASLVVSQFLGTAKGEGGEIRITSDNISLKGRSFVSTGADRNTMGDAGDIILNADTISITEDSSFDSLTQNDFNSGDINITTRVLEITGGGELNVTTRIGEGNGGNLTINASELVSIRGLPIDEEAGDANRSGLSANSLNGSGNAGNINVFTNELIIDDGGTITAGNFKDFGDTPPGTGEPGNINIEANSISLTDEARIRVTTQSPTGDKGNITINTGKITLRNNSFISAEARNNANGGGKIDLNVDSNIELRNNSRITAQAFNNANGGNINIDTDFIIAFPNQNNDIIASAEEGQGGNINITAEALFGIEERPLNDITNDINASSEFGLDGNVSIVTPDIKRFQTDIKLPDNPIEAEQTVAQACQGDRYGGISSNLTVKGKGGISPTPIDPLYSDEILVDNQELNILSNLQTQYPDIKPIKTSIGDIYPARGIIKTVDGRIILTAYATDNINTRTPHKSSNCVSP